MNQIKANKSQKGFTLIELVLVLAIAGLILAVIFFAVTGAQRARRNDDRKQAAARFLAQMEQYAGNNQGAYPTTNAQITTVVGQMNNFNDPLSGNVYAAVYGVGALANPGDMRGGGGLMCTNGTVAVSPNQRQAAVAVYQEGNTTYCVQN